MLVLAGAGTGKTRVIVERLAYLVHERGVAPRHVLAVTFTNRAAREMRSRVVARLGAQEFGAWIGTFHALGLWVLMRYMERLGRCTPFVVLDETDTLSLMKRLVQELPPKWAKVSPKTALHRISLLKQNLEEPGGGAAANSPEEETYRELWERYHRALETMSAVDFDDLLVLPVRLLEGDEEVCGRLQERFRYIHVDEYQDTNRAQYRMAKHLSERHGNLFVVGDEDQSIYSWRGATLRNILDFERDFPGAKTFRLEQNYRSAPAILNAANALVSFNRERLGKNLWTAEKRGEPVRFYSACDSEDEARFVVEDILRRNVAPGSVAVLYRTNGQARAMEQALKAKQMPYVVVGGVRFYGRKEVKDLLSYLRLLVNPLDNESLRRILNVPPRGVGRATLEHIETYAAERGISLLQALRETDFNAALATRARNSIAEFLRVLDDLASSAKSAKVLETVRALIERIGYREYLQDAFESDNRARREIVDEFLSGCAQFDEQETGRLPDFLNNLALMTDIDEWDPNVGAVTLMTCHSAKGLEFDEVFLIGLEEGLLPHAAAVESQRELEEERRLCYVAMTRARKWLTLAAADRRMIAGEWHDCRPSRFLAEMACETFARVPRPAGLHSAASKPAAGGCRVPTKGPRLEREEGAFRTGTRVRHAKFGLGVIQYTQGTGPKQRVRVRFETGRVLTLVTGIAPLEVLSGDSSDVG